MHLQDPSPSPWSALSRRLRDAGGSLKLRITLGGIAALGLSIALTSLLLVSRAERATLATEREHELTESVRTAALLSRRVIELQRALASVVPQLDAATLASEPALARFAKNQPFLRRLFEMLFIADREGRVRMYADEQGIGPQNGDVADREYFRRAVAEGRSQISGVVRNKRSGEPVVIFAQPVVEAGVVRAVVSGILRLTDRDLLDGLVEVQEGNAASAMLIVTDAAGLVLAHPDRARVMGSLVDEPRLSRAFADWQRLGAPVEPQGLAIEQPGELVSVTGVPGPDWLVWRVRSEALLLAPLHEARQDALRAAAGLVALFSAGLLLMLGWLLGPLDRLQDRALHLFDGTLAPQDGWPVAGGEIGDLARVLRRVGSDRNHLELRNAEVLGQLRSVMRAAPAGIAIVRDGRFELVGTALRRLLGFDAEPSPDPSGDPLLGHPVQRIFSSHLDHPRFAILETQAFARRCAYMDEWRLRRDDGTRFWARLHSKPVDADDPSRGAIWIVDDIDEAHAAHEHLKWTATHDPLTGLANRGVLTQRAETLIATLPHARPAVIVFIDLDHFKPVNDLAGHGAGDLMLLAVARAMTTRVRGDDLVARLGGDEFALLLEDCSHDTALRIARDVREAIARIAMPWEGGTLTVGASLGVASLTARTRDIAQWLGAADAACYAAKRAGRGGVRSASSPQTSAPSDRRSV